MNSIIMIVEVWEDVVCPWCYLGDNRFEAALAKFAHRDEVKVTRRSFELDPAAPLKSSQTIVQLLSSKYGISLEEAEQREKQLSETAASEGLTIRPDRVPVNTRDAHRLLHLAADHGHQDTLAKLLFAAYFAKGEVVSDKDTLVRIASEAGIDTDEARDILRTDAYGKEVAADENEARALGANGVPFYVFDRRYGISGAQPTEVFLQALEQAWKESAPSSNRRG